MRGRILLVDGGNTAPRRLASEFGAGAARFGIEGEATRADGTPLGSFRDERRSAFGGLGSITLIERCMARVGRDVAKMITTGKYSQTGGDREE